MKILEFKRSGIRLIAEFCGILNGSPNQGVKPGAEDCLTTPACEVLLFAEILIYVSA